MGPCRGEASCRPRAADATDFLVMTLQGAIAQETTASDPWADKLMDILARFSKWLSAYGESSLDYQTFYAGPIGAFAKTLYYRNRGLGIAAVAPMVFCEAFIPSVRRFFYRRIRFPIADAHFAMGFAFLYEATGDSFWFER